MDKLKLELLSDLSNNFSTEQLLLIDKVLTYRLDNYDISAKSTELTLQDTDIPVEIKSFLVCKSMKGLTSSSLTHYKRTLEHFIYNINKTINTITTNDVRMYLLSYEKGRGVCKSTIDDKRRVLNSFFSWLIREEIITKNPMLKIDNIKCDKRIHEPLTDLELEQLRGVCTNKRDIAILETLYSTGCRVSELIALNRSNVDFTNGRVKVFGKGKKERWCFLNAKSQIALKKYLFNRTDNNEALFVVNKNPYNRMGKGSIEKQIKHCGILANINTKVTPHTIRRTTATHMLSHGASLSDVQALLGHERSETTLIYAKLDISNLQSVHKRCII